MVMEFETLGKSLEVAVTVYDSLLLLLREGTNVADVAVVEDDDVGLLERVQVTPPFLGSLLTVALSATVSPAPTAVAPVDVMLTAGCDLVAKPPLIEPLPLPQPTNSVVMATKRRYAMTTRQSQLRLRDEAGINKAVPSMS
jgi:hypothetical protein